MRGFSRLVIQQTQTFVRLVHHDTCGCEAREATHRCTTSARAYCYYVVYISTTFGTAGVYCLGQVSGRHSGPPRHVCRHSGPQPLRVYIIITRTLRYTARLARYTGANIITEFPPRRRQHNVGFKARVRGKTGRGGYRFETGHRVSLAASDSEKHVLQTRGQK